MQRYFSCVCHWSLHAALIEQKPILFKRLWVGGGGGGHCKSF